jgi:hypothetical protein
MTLANHRQKASVQLSIIMPTHRHDLLALSRIAQACSWARPNVEIVIRDNSGNAEKRAALKFMQRDNCTIVSVDECDARENYIESMRLAKGEFVFVLADDDMCFDQAIAAIPAILDRIAKDPSTVGIAGPYIVEAAAGSVVINYKAIDSADPAARVAGYLTETGPNVLFFAVLRRDVVLKVAAFVEGLPMLCSFVDQIMSLIYLMSGKYHLLPRLFYLYDYGLWETTETAQKRDTGYYAESGFDPAINLLHWFMCAFEGAVLALHSDAFPAHPQAQRQQIANLWFSTMFLRFKNNKRLTFGSKFTGEVEKAAAKMQAMAGTVTFDVMLLEICAVLKIFSEEKAQRYFDYWDAMLNHRKSPVRVAAAKSEPAEPVLS